MAYLVDMEVAKTGRWFVDALAKSFDFRKNARDIFVRAPLAGAARLAPLDGVRALAFMWVSADHAMKTIETDIGASSCVFLQRAVSEQTASAWLCTFITYWADFGVTLFFVLSGFLIVYIIFHMMEKEQRFFAHAGQVLKFDLFWDDRGAWAGQRNVYVMHYYLADDAVEIRTRPQPGFDKFPCLLKRSKLPKNWEAARRGSKPEYFNFRELRTGETVNVFGREMLIIDCDAFTRWSETSETTGGSGRVGGLERRSARAARCTHPSP